MADLSIRPDELGIRRARTTGEIVDLPRRLTTAAAATAIVVVGLLLIFIGWNGLALFVTSHIPLDRVFSTSWLPADAPDVASGAQYSFGILPFVAGTLGVMVVAAIITTPLSVGLALFMAEIAPGWARSITQPAMEIFVGIPSVVYGWLGLTILVPFLNHQLGGLGFKAAAGFSLFAGALVLAIMILPTIASVSYDAFRAVPADLRTASLSMGTTRWQTIRHVLIPAALPGVATAVVLGMMRAAGEALAVQMVIGNRPVMPAGLTQPMTTLTSQITLDMGNTVSGEPWNQALWFMAVILLAISFAFVVLVRVMARERRPA